MNVLADATAAAAYSQSGIAPDDAAAATHAADQVRDQLTARATRRERLRWAMGMKTVKESPSPGIRAVETLVPR